eukprot:m.273484 g.273484  ORF g.273484 m.273484 type:complete len:56 (-) comp19755_c0_seq32:2444-2611(-)
MGLPGNVTGTCTWATWYAVGTSIGRAYSPQTLHTSMQVACRALMKQGTMYLQWLS